jgi:Pollen protein Ole e 1 like
MPSECNILTVAQTTHDPCITIPSDFLSDYGTGAKVKVECRSKSTGVKNFEGVTDHTGTYNIPVANEHEHELCETVLLSSPDSSCAKLVNGRERARVFLTHNNGLSSDVRYANAMGFEKEIAFASCTELLKMYEQDED